MVRRDWRLARLREIQATEPLLVPTAPAFVISNELIGYYVVRPGVPDHDARQSWHLTSRRARRVAAAWNEALRDAS